jgi:aspartyl protease family protein
MKNIPQSFVFMILLFILFFLPRFVCAEVFRCITNGHASYSSSPCASGNIFYYGKRAPPVVPPAPSVTIVRGRNGLYSLPGSIDGIDVTFIIDTGSNTTTISGELASQLGVDSCLAVGISRTANGDAIACRVKVASLTIAEFKFVDITITVLPAMKGVALLGNDLLSQLKVSHQGDEMKISK